MNLRNKNALHCIPNSHSQIGLRPFPILELFGPIPFAFYGNWIEQKAQNGA